MSTMHTHILCVIVVAFVQGGSLLAGVSLHHAAWEACTCMYVGGLHVFVGGLHVYVGGLHV